MFFGLGALFCSIGFRQPRANGNALVVLPPTSAVLPIYCFFFARLCNGSGPCQAAHLLRPSPSSPPSSTSFCLVRLALCRIYMPCTYHDAIRDLCNEILKLRTLEFCCSPPTRRAPGRGPRARTRHLQTEAIYALRKPRWPRPCAQGRGPRTEHADGLAKRRGSPMHR